MLLAVFASTAAHALPPPRPGLVDPLTNRYRTTGDRVPVFPKALKAHRPSPQKGKYPLAPRAGVPGVRPLAIPPGPGTLRPLVVLVDFADKPRSRQPAEFAPLFFGAAPAASVATYWREVSYGTFGVSGGSADIIGWIRPSAAPAAPGEFLSSIVSYSDITDPVSGVDLANLRQLIADIVLYLDPSVDFGPYADPATGAVLSLILVHAGTGQEDTGMSADLYSHSASVGPIPTSDPGGAHRVADYAIVPELQSFDPATGSPTPVLIAPGVIVHEMGHLLALPDLYPTTGANGQAGLFSGVGVFDLMGYGLWGNNLIARPDVPAHLSAWSRSRAGWLVPSLRIESGARALQPAAIFPEADKVFSNSPADPTQYFLVENRQISSSLGSWTFDKFLPGQGLLVWQIDEAMIAGSPDNVNSDPSFRGVYVKEADGVYHMAVRPVGINPTDRAIYYGEAGDYFFSTAQRFTRTLPSAAVNSTPIVDNVVTRHPFDFGTLVEMSLFSRNAANVVSYFLDIKAGGSSVPSWRTFNEASTQRYPLDNTLPRAPMRSNNIVSIGFDSGNNVWLGSRDQGIFRFLGTSFEFLNTLQGLPSPGPGGPAGASVAPVQAMVFERDTGSMWVGTDQGIFKVRDPGGGYRVTVSLTESSPGNRRLPAAVAGATNDIRALLVRTGFIFGGKKVGLKYAATRSGLIRINDLNLDGDPADPVGVILAGDMTSVALDDNGTPDAAADDVLWAGDASGNVYRSLLPAEAGGSVTGDPTSEAQFKKMLTLSGNRITTLAVDKAGLLWVGTDRSGLLVYDLGETLGEANLEDPFDFNADGSKADRAFLDASRGLASNHVTGIAFQAGNAALKTIAWLSNTDDGFNAGGASRFDSNLTSPPGAPTDERVKVYRPEPGVLPENQTQGPASSAVRAAAADASGNLWFGTGDPTPAGASRFGNAGVISLDRSNYVNTGAIAQVTLQDDGLNDNASLVNLTAVIVRSGLDATGIVVILRETGPDTGVFRGEFGFTLGASEQGGSMPLVSVVNGSVVTVSYQDANPPGFREASATWKNVFPFDDSLLVGGFRCFVASAAYGSALAPEVRTLRAFRDRYLLGHGAGRAFVSLYYAWSPALAAVVADSRALRWSARALLAPASLAAGFAVASTAPEKAAVAALLPALAFAFGLRRGRRRGRAAGGSP